MRNPRSHEISELLFAWSRGDQAALDQLVPLVYGELRKLASGYLRGERSDHTLQPTALIHEAYLRLVGQDTPRWENRAHFYGVAARIMRQILVDHARTHAAVKRGGDWQRLPLHEESIFSRDDAAELLAFDEALDKLAVLDERKCQVVVMRSFGGMSVEETAAALGLSEPTIKREMRLAKAWLLRELELS